MRNVVVQENFNHDVNRKQKIEIDIVFVVRNTLIRLIIASFTNVLDTIKYIFVITPF